MNYISFVVEGALIFVIIHIEVFSPGVLLLLLFGFGRLVVVEFVSSVIVLGFLDLLLDFLHNLHLLLLELPLVLQVCVLVVLTYSSFDWDVLILVFLNWSFTNRLLFQRLQALSQRVLSPCKRHNALLWCGGLFRHLRPWLNGLPRDLLLRLYMLGNVWCIICPSIIARLDPLMPVIYLLGVRLVSRDGVVASQEFILGVVGLI